MLPSLISLFNLVWKEPRQIGHWGCSCFVEYPQLSLSILEKVILAHLILSREGHHLLPSIPFTFYLSSLSFLRLWPLLSLHFNFNQGQDILPWCLGVRSHVSLGCVCMCVCICVDIEVFHIEVSSLF